MRAVSSKHPCFAVLRSAERRDKLRRMADRAIVATGTALVLGVALAFVNWWIGIALLAIGIFLIVWGLFPDATEAKVGSVAPPLLAVLQQLKPFISPPPATTPPEIVDLQASADWAIHNLLNRQPVPSTTAEIDALERDYQDWEASVSAKLADPLFLHTEKARFDTLGFVTPVRVYRDPRLDQVLSYLKLKLERLNEAIQAAQQRAMDR